MHAPTILVPRPTPQLASTLQMLHSSGFAHTLPLPIASPIFTETLPPLPAPQGLIFTSSLALHPQLPKVPCACVGARTAHMAQAAGFPVLCTGTGNANLLAQQLVAMALPPQHFWHAHGNHSSLSWHHLLTNAGHQVHALKVYHTHRIQQLPHGVASALRQNFPHVTLLFSAGSANHLAKLLKQANIAPNGIAIALSPQVAAASAWPHTLTAANPSLAAMVTCLKEEFRT